MRRKAPLLDSFLFSSARADFPTPLDEPIASCVVHGGDMLATSVGELVDATNAFGRLRLPNTP